MSTKIDEVLSSSNPTTKPLSGVSIAHGGSLGQSTTFTIQVVPPSSGAWSVSLEGGITPSNGGPPKFDPIADFDESSEQTIVTLPLTLGVQYRWRHVSGGDVTCRLAV